MNDVLEQINQAKEEAKRILKEKEEKREQEKYQENLKWAQKRIETLPNKIKEYANNNSTNVDVCFSYSESEIKSGKYKILFDELTKLNLAPKFETAGYGSDITYLIQIPIL